MYNSPVDVLGIGLSYVNYRSNYCAFYFIILNVNTENKSESAMSTHVHPDNGILLNVKKK